MRPSSAGSPAPSTPWLSDGPPPTPESLYPEEVELVKDAVEKGIGIVTPAHLVLKAAYVAVMQQQDAAAAARKGCGAEHHASGLTSVNLAKRFAAEAAVEPAEGVHAWLHQAAPDGGSCSRAIAVAGEGSGDSAPSDKEGVQHIPQCDIYLAAASHAPVKDVKAGHAEAPSKGVFGSPIAQRGNNCNLHIPELL